MKRIVASGLAAIAAALALGSLQPAQAETRCWRNGNSIQCQNVQPYRDYRNYRPYNNYRNYNYNYRTYVGPLPYNNYNRYTFYGYGYNSDLARAINQIYRQELGRNADVEGLGHYINQYYNGWSLSDIRRDIANSREAYNLRGYY
jgi:hypothetical protein